MADDQQSGSLADETRLDLLDLTLRYCTEEFDLANETFAALDGKAQATFGVSGLFVAGTVALLNTVGDSSSVPWWIVAGAALCYALLVGAIVTALVALKVREVATPLKSDDVVRMTLDVIALPDAELSLERRANWYRDQLAEWLRVIRKLEEVNLSKACWVTMSQIMLIGAVLCAGAVTFGFGFT